MATKSLYMCLRLASDDEHKEAYMDMAKFIVALRGRLSLLWYRPLRDGHVPNHMEVKFRGSHKAIAKFKRWFSPNTAAIVENPNRAKFDDIYLQFQKKIEEKRLIEGDRKNGQI